MKEYDRTFTEPEIMAIIAAADDESAHDLGYKTFSFSANAEMLRHYCTLSATDSEDLTCKVIICVDLITQILQAYYLKTQKQAKKKILFPTSRR